MVGNLVFLLTAAISSHSQDSYAAEESIHHAGNFDAQKSARLLELEHLLDAHKAEEVRLAQQVQHYRALSEKLGGTTGEIAVREAAQDPSSAVGSSLKALLEKNAALEEEIAELVRDNDALNGDLEALEAQLEALATLRAQGNFDRSTTRCLELAGNPEGVDREVRESTLSQLKAENAALVARIDVLEKRAGVAAGEGMVPRESWERLGSEVKRLEGTLRDKEKMAVRLRDVSVAASAADPR